MSLTIGRIVVVHQSGAEIPAIVSEVGPDARCCVTAFPPRRSPVTILDLPVFASRHDAMTWLASQSAQNTHVGYLPYGGDAAPAPLDSLSQVTSELEDNDVRLRELAARAVEHDLQDVEIGRTLPPIQGTLNVPIDPVRLGLAKE